MQFKHPELLYALLLLLIPIIVHLFQLRRFKETPFTNVAFLKEVVLQTRKSSQLKKWLTLLTRMLMLGAIILAFAQPFTTNSDIFNKTRETVIYLDNSYSMQAKGSKGELLKRALQETISGFPEDEELSILTNTNAFKNTTIKAIKNDLLQIQYSTGQLSYDAMQIKASKLFSKDPNSVKNLILISDFQQQEDPFVISADTSIQTRIVQLRPANLNNAYVDSVAISKIDVNTLKLDAIIKNSGESVENLPISLFNGPNLTAKTSVSLNGEAKVQFDLPIREAIQGRLVINDNQLQFDDEFYFNIIEPEKINVLSINNSDDSFLQRVYSEDEFNYSSADISRMNFSDFQNQNIIVLNELNSIPNSLITAIHNYTDKGGYVLIIPSVDLNINSYNQLFTKYNLATFGDPIKTEKKITTINYSHPLYAGVFDKRIDNFQYPKVEFHYPINKDSGSSILQYEDGSAFLQKNANAYIFTSAINTANSNFKNSPLIVPTLYNIAKQSLALPDLYFTIGRTNTYDVKTAVQKDNVLKLAKDELQIIPQQVPTFSRIRITTDETPSQAGIYNILNSSEIVKKVSYNYNRDESVLRYNDIEKSYPELLMESISDVFEEIKSDMKINELWKWFVIFALFFLIMEMLILKYIK